MLKRTQKLHLALLCLLLSTSSFVVSAVWDCRNEPLKPGKTNDGCIVVGEKNRYFKIHLPAANDDSRKKAIIIGLHGGAGKPARFERYTRLSKLSDETGEFIAVYPEGIDRHWNDGRMNFNTSIDDVRFFSELILHLTNLPGLPTDRNRVFITGISNGGLMTMRFACERPDLIAGAAVVAASMTDALLEICAT